MGLVRFKLRIPEVVSRVSSASRTSLISCIIKWNRNGEVDRLRSSKHSLNLNVIIIHPSRSHKYTECVVMALESVSANKSTQSTRLFSVLVKALYIEGGEMDKGCRERWSSSRLMNVFIWCRDFVCRIAAWFAVRLIGSPPPARQSIVFACNFRYVINYADSFSDNQQQQRKTG